MRRPEDGQQTVPIARLIKLLTGINLSQLVPRAIYKDVMDLCKKGMSDSAGIEHTSTSN